MANLYEIDEQLKVLEEYMCDPETGELLTEEEFYKKLDEVEMALSDKIENTMCFYKNLMSDVEQFKSEEKKIAERRKGKENLANRLQNRIDYYIRHQFTDEEGNVDNKGLNAYKFETPKVKLSYRKSDKIEIKDLSKVPKKYIKEHELSESDIKKTDIKKLMKQNGETDNDYAKIETNISMQVK